MKVTIYELLGMVKDGKAPNKVKYKDIIYYYYNGYDFDYIYNSGTVSPLDRNNSLFKFSSYEIKDDRINWNDNAMIDFLNDEVEIIEEEPRDINVAGSWLTKSEYDELAHSEEEKKIPEKLEPLQKEYMTIDDIKFTFSISEMILVDKINSIIDYLKSKGE